MTELNVAEWSKAIITAQEKEETMLTLDTFDHVIYIKNHGLNSITKNDLKYIDVIYPFLCTAEQLKVKNYIAEKFDLVNTNMINDQIKALRVDFNITQQKLSDITGIPKRTIEDWERYASRPADYMPELIQAKLKEHFKK